VVLTLHRVSGFIDELSSQEVELSMYRKFLRFAAACCILSSAWSVIRVFNISIFEWLTLLVVPAVLLHSPPEKGVPLGSFKLLGAGLAVLAIAGVISSPSSFDAVEHILKVSKLLGAFALIVGLSFALANRKIYNLDEILYLLCLSATASSLVAVLQGQFGILTGLIPRDAAGGIQSWTRMTGLAEHPVEAGVVSSYGFIIGLGLALHTRKWRAALPMIAINAYSMRYSASLTAVFGFVLATLTLCLYTKSFKVLFSGFAIGALTVAAVLTLSTGTSGLLQRRLTSLYETQGNYETVQIRSMQLHKAIDMIDVRTLAVGNGYSQGDLPFNMEIHNGLVASVFHFGLLGLISQCLLIGFFVTKLANDAPRPLKGILLGCIIVFALSYISGPPQARPTLWGPVILLGGYLGTQRKERLSGVTLPIFGRADLETHAQPRR
jgi:hypothetical protein